MIGRKQISAIPAAQALMMLQSSPESSPTRKPQSSPESSPVKKRIARYAKLYDEGSFSVDASPSHEHAYAKENLNVLSNVTPARNTQISHLTSSQKRKLDQIEDSNPLNDDEPVVPADPTAPASANRDIFNPRQQNYPVSATRSKRLQAHEGEARVGIIDKIIVKNFMCHTNMEFPFGSNVTVVQGENGSGKSAIVAALQLCLGANANVTERGKKQSSHIKYGCDKATIQVYIRNRPPLNALQGDERYHPELFGDTIIIEKIITESSSQFKFRNHNEQIVKISSSPKKQLQEILDHFNIVVDNPVSVLTQHKCKSFLKDSDPKGMYKLFMEASYIQQAYDGLHELDRTLKQTKETLQQKTRDFKEDQVRVQKLHDIYEGAKEMHSLKDRIEELGNLLAWTKVGDQEAVLRATENEAQEIQDELDRIQKQQTGIQEEHNEMMRELQEKEVLFEEETKVLSEFRNRLEKCNSDIQKVEGDVNKLKQAERSAIRLARDTADRLNTLQRELQKEREKAQQGSDPNEMRIHESLEESKAWLEEAENMIQELSQKRDLMLSKIDAKSNEIRAAERERESAQRHLAQREEQYDKLKGLGNDRIRRFGHHLDGLVKAIEREYESGKFSMKPIGPVGSFVSVRDPKWGKAAQLNIGENNLRTFLVNTRDDMEVLKRLMHRSPVAHSIVITDLKSKKYDISESQRPPREFMTLVDQLVIDHPAVFNFLVDFCDLERNVLLEDSRDMETVPFSNIPNTKQCWSIDGTRAYSSKSSRTTRRPDRDVTVLINRDMRESVNLLEGQITQAKIEVKANDEVVKHLVDERETLTHEHQKIIKDLREADMDKKKYTTKVRQLSRQLSEMAIEFDETAMKANIAVVKKEIEEHENSAKLATEKLQELQDKIKVMDEKRDEIKNEGLLYREKLVETEKSVKQLSRKVSTSEVKLKKLKDAREQLLESQKENQNKFSEQKRELERAFEIAELISPERLDPKGKTFEQINSQIEQLQRRLEKEQARRDGKTIEQIEKEYVEAEEALKKTEVTLTQTNHYREKLHEGYKNRKKKVKKMQRFLQELINKSFEDVMATRGNSGSIDINDAEETLSLSVKLASHRRANGSHHETTSMKQLSGGEKSSVTFAFMLAIGEAMNVPFRVMDEFDVYLDDAARKGAYMQLIQTANQLPNKQFIFLTPLSLTFGSKDRVKVIRMRKPDRVSNPAHGMDQTTLDEFTS